MQTHVPSGRGLPGPSPPRTGSGRCSAVFCRPKEGRGCQPWAQFLEPLSFSATRGPKFGQKGLEILQGSVFGRAVSAQ